MKRIILLLFAVVLAFSSCENLEDNSPGFQGEIDSVFFKAQDVRGTQNEDGSFTLQGISQGRKITLNLQKAQLGVYELGGGRASSASYEDSSDDVYTTSPFGDGKIEITDRCLTCGWLTGSFNFNARRSENDTLSVGVQKGFFFEVSFLNDNVDIGVSTNGAMSAEVNDTVFNANSVTVDVVGEKLIINGLVETSSIRIELPVNSVGGNYSLPREGFDASYTINGVTTQASTGLISVNFNDTSTRAIRIFFNFEAGSDIITVGNTRVDY
ncbi:MAG: hypothetical protein JKY22_04450 [Flavobacteriaceae bacterium]|nr:hypothetical protein [Flavobacteriaceae bacterium]